MKNEEGDIKILPCSSKRPSLIIISSQLIIAERRNERINERTAKYPEVQGSI